MASKKLRSVELFTGAGGLAMGLELAGFEHCAAIEWDHDSCETIRENQRQNFPLVKNWNIHECDVRNFDYSTIQEDIDLVAGGPPCQPFSLAGKHKGFDDSRDMWSEAVRSTRELNPRAFIFENVKGLLRHAFDTYFAYILLQLSFPSVARKKNEDWITHSRRLEKLEKNGSKVEYRVKFKLLNAADYGVPQKRERVVIVGFRSDLNVTWDFPTPTHSHRHITVNDAISDLPNISSTRPTSKTPNHSFQKGARFYKGHTGSRLDESAKTLKAGAHGVPGGENMIDNNDGTCRYFSVREAARLQCFPDGYIFPGSWSASMRQLGNAVPVLLAKVLGQSVANALRDNSIDDKKGTPILTYGKHRELQSA